MCNLLSLQNPIYWNHLLIFIIDFHIMYAHLENSGKMHKTDKILSKNLNWLNACDCVSPP